MNGRRIIAFLAALFMACTLMACGDGGGSAVQPTPTAASLPEETPFPAHTVYQAAIRKMDGVVEVSPVLQDMPNIFAEKYLITFELPVDAEKPELGSFRTRVLLGIRGLDAPNVVLTDASGLTERQMAREDHEAAKLISGNYIHIEQRFSDPELCDMDADGVFGWEYLTVRHSAGDVHRIISALSEMLTGQWIVTGRGEGGTLALSCAMLYPEDFCLSLSYCAPLADGEEDNRLFSFISSSIGDLGYGKTAAAKYRKMTAQFQIECIRRREQFAPRFFDYAQRRGASYSENVSRELLYDLCVAEWGRLFWESGSDFTALEKVLTMRSSEEKDEALFAVLVSCGTEKCFSRAGGEFARYVQYARELGYCGFELSALRKTLEAEGLETFVTKEAEEGLWRRVMFTPEQQAAFLYSHSLYEELTAWLESTQQQVIEICGGADPWYALRMPEGKNPHVRVYLSPAGSHLTGISDLNNSDRLEIYHLLQNAAESGEE